MARALFANELTVPAICGDIGVCAPVSPKQLLKSNFTHFTKKYFSNVKCPKGFKMIEQ
jgi:hypothetical protein